MSNKLLALLAALILLAAAAGCASTGTETVAPEPKADDNFKKGEELLKSGKYEQARQVYSSVKEVDPEKTYEPLVQIRLGDSYYEEARYAEADVEYKRFLDLHPHNKAAPYVKYQLGMCNFKQIDLPDRDPSFAENSVKHFSELLKDYPNNPYEDEAKEKLKIAKDDVAAHELVVGRFYYKKDSYMAAVKRFKGIIDNYPGSKDEPEILYYMADSYIRLEDYESAKNTLAQLYKDYPNNKMSEKARDNLAEKIPAK